MLEGLFLFELLLYEQPLPAVHPGEGCTGLQERIEIMHALSTSAPQLGQSRSVMQDSLPVPSAPPMTGGPDDGTLTYPHVWQPFEGEHVLKLTPDIHLS